MCADAQGQTDNRCARCARPVDKRRCGQTTSCWYGGGWGGGDARLATAAGVQPRLAPRPTGSTAELHVGTGRRLTGLWTSAAGPAVGPIFVVVLRQEKAYGREGARAAASRRVPRAPQRARVAQTPQAPLPAAGRALEKRKAECAYRELHAVFPSAVLCSATAARPSRPDSRPRARATCSAARPITIASRPSPPRNRAHARRAR